MKKAVSLILLLIFTASLFTACSKEKTEETQTEYKPDFEIVNEVPQERTAGKMQAAEHFSGGDGSENNPYQISTPEELQLFSDVVNNQKSEDEINYAEAYYVLNNDIEFNSAADMENADKKAPAYAWTPIGQGSDNKAHEFKGHFDGNGKKITGLYVISAYHGMDDCRSYIGMFSTINKAEIKDLTISNSYFYAYNGIDSLAAVAGEAYCSKIENCHTIDTYCYATSAEVAQILGTAISTVYIKNCSAEGKVESSHSHEIAGITAGANDGTIEGCINNAEIINNYGTASGICGLLTDSAAQTDKNGNVISEGKTYVYNCKNNGSITATSAEAGGISASITAGNSEIEINKCENSGVVEGKNMVGGIAGSIYASKNYVGRKDGKTNQGAAAVKECLNTGNVNAVNGTAGGICGHVTTEYQAKIVVENSKNKDCVVSGATVGGIIGIHSVGINDDSGTISVTSCSNSGTFGENPASLGGIFGTVAMTKGGRESGEGITIKIDGCVNDTDFNLNKVGYGTGGIIGCVNSDSISGDTINVTNCINNGSFTAVMNAGVLSLIGGICGASDTVGEETLAFRGCINNGGFDITLVEKEKEKTEEDEKKIYCYVGGLCGSGYDKTIIDNCSNNGKFNLVSGNEKKIRFDNSVSLKMNINDAVQNTGRQNAKN